MSRIAQQEIDAAAIELVTGLKKHFEELRRNSNKYEEWELAEKAYYNDISDFYNGIAKVRVPALHEKVEIIVPKMDKVNFPPDGEFFEAAAVDHTDDIVVEDAEIVTALIKKQFKDVNVRSKMIKGYRSLCVYGTLWVAIFWEHKLKSRYKRIDGKRQKVWETAFDNPDFYFPDIRDIYIDPKDENLEGFLIERVVKDWHELNSIAQLEDSEGNSIYRQDSIVDLKEGSGLKEEDDGTNSHESRSKDSDDVKGLGQHKFSKWEKKIEVLKCWGDVPKWMITGNQEDRDSEEVEENALIEIGVNGSCIKVLRIIDNPLDHMEKPYLRGRYIAVDGAAYGLGVMTVNIPLQMELNTLRSQLMDMRSFALKKKWLVDRNANVDQSQLKDLHNVVIDIDDVNGIKDVQFMDFSAAGISQEAIIKRDIEDGTGASKLLGGSPTGGSLDRTATAVSLVTQGGLERFELVVTQFQEEIMKPLVKHFWMLNQQFLPEGRDVSITGNKMIRVIPSEISLAGFDLNFLGLRELGEKEFKINALNILIQNISPFVSLGLDPIPIIMRFFKLTGMGDLEKEVDKRPETQLEETPEGEVQLLQMGRNVRINMNDDHVSYLKAYETLLKRVITSDLMSDRASYTKDFINAINNSQLPDNVRKNLAEAVGQRLAALQIQETGFKSNVATE